MKVNFFHVLVGGAVMVTVGMATILWTNDSRTSGDAGRQRERPGLHSPSQSEGTSSPVVSREREPEKELSILPIGRHPKVEDLGHMDLSQRVQAHEQRRNEFMRERMASLAAQVSND